MANPQHRMVRTLRPAPSGARVLVLLASLVFAAGAVQAHGAGGAAAVDVRSLPAWVAWAAGGLVVALSFAIVGIFLTRETEPEPRDGDPVAPGDVTGLPRGLVGALRLLGLLGLAVVFAAGLVPWNPGAGVSRLVWVGLWGLGVVLAYGVGNWWVLVSPFRALAGLADRLRGGAPPMAYPDRLGAWPAVVLLLGIVVLEALAPGSSTLAYTAIAYTGFTLAGMVAYGARPWLARVEVFDRVFAWFASIGPGRLTADGLVWSWPGEPLSRERAADAGDASFVVALVYATNADGFLATGAGRALTGALSGLGPGVASALVITAGFGLFLAAFWGCAAWIARVTETLSPVSRIASVFAVTLVPIGVGYHLAHNLTLVVDGLPLLFDALADPLALNPSTASAWTVLSSRPTLVASLSIATVVLGHVGAVVLAHRRSFTSFPGKVQAVKSELPLTALMVLYTLVSLWIVTAGHAGGAV